MNHINLNGAFHRGLPLRAGLWLAQLLLAGVYLSTGLAVLLLPATEVLAIAPWAEHVPAAVLRFIGGVDMAAGLGVLLPSLTRIAPGLSVLAATCSLVLQILAIFSYALLGALGPELFVNLAIFTLSAFVVWGRSGTAPIASRWQGRRMADVEAFVINRADRSDGRPRMRRGLMRRGGNSLGSKRFRVQRSLRDAPFHRAQKEVSRR